MRIDCIGGGSVGLLLAGRLALAGCEVTLVTRTAEQAGRIREAGLTVLDANGAPVGQANVRCLEGDRYPDRPGDAPDWILLAVKQKDIDEALLQMLKDRADPAALICCFQNGIGHLEKLLPAVGPGRLYAAVTTEGARRTGLGEVRHTGRGHTYIGAADKLFRPEEAAGGLPRFVEMLAQAGFSAEMSNTIENEIWNKLIINAVINPLTAILQVPNGKILESAAALPLMKDLFAEAEDLARVLGIAVAEDLWERLSAVCRATALNRSSMLQDLEAGRRTELEWLNGSLLRQAARIGEELPVHETVYRLVKAREELAAALAGNSACGATPDTGQRR